MDTVTRRVYVALVLYWLMLLGGYASWLTYGR